MCCVKLNRNIVHISALIVMYFKAHYYFALLLPTPISGAIGSRLIINWEYVGEINPLKHAKLLNTSQPLGLAYILDTMDMGADDTSPYIGDDGYNTTISRPYLPTVVIATGERCVLSYPLEYFYTYWGYWCAYSKWSPFWPPSPLWGKARWPPLEVWYNWGLYIGLWYPPITPYLVYCTF